MHFRIGTGLQPIVRIVGVQLGVRRGGGDLGQDYDDYEPAAPAVLQRNRAAVSEDDRARDG